MSDKEPQDKPEWEGQPPQEGEVERVGPGQQAEASAAAVEEKPVIDVGDTVVQKAGETSGPEEPPPGGEPEAPDRDREPEQRSGAGGGFSFLLFLLILGVGGAAYLLWQQTGELQQQLDQRGQEAASASSTAKSAAEAAQSASQAVATARQELGSRLGGVEKRVGSVSAQLDSVNTRLSRLSGELNAVNGRVNALDETVKNTFADRLKALAAHLSELDDNVAAASGTVSGLRDQLGALEQQLGQTKGEVGPLKGRIDSLGSDLRALQEQVPALEQQLSGLKSALASLDQALAAARAQQTELSGKLDATKAELNRNVRNWVASEAAYLIRSADDHLRLDGDVAVAKAALERAADRLAGVPDASLDAVRSAVKASLASLAGLSRPDIAGTAAALGSLSMSVAGMPFPQEDSDQAAVPPPAEDWRTALSTMWDEVKEWVVVKKRDQLGAPFTPPAAREFLRLNLHLKLEAARLAVLQKDQQAFSDSIKTARDWITTYFDKQAPATQRALAKLDSIAQVDLQPDLPDLSGPLNAMSTWLAEHGGRGAGHS